MKDKNSDNRARKLRERKRLKERIKECDEIEQTFPQNQQCSKDGKNIKNRLVAIRDD